MEEWKVIREFPTYEVSNRGQVRNLSTGRTLKQTKHPTTGLLWVGLRKNMAQHTRTVHRLVASEFLFEGPEDSIPIHLDGNRENNTPENLDWKPRTFARELTAERNRAQPIDPRKVLHIEHEMEYANALEAAKHLGGLEKYILLAARSSGRTSYKGGHWVFV